MGKGFLAKFHYKLISNLVNIYLSKTEIITIFPYCYGAIFFRSAQVIILTKVSGA